MGLSSLTEQSDEKCKGFSQVQIPPVGCDVPCLQCQHCRNIMGDAVGKEVTTKQPELME